MGATSTARNRSKQLNTTNTTPARGGNTVVSTSSRDTALTHGSLTPNEGASSNSGSGAGSSSAWDERGSMALLVLLYMVQGIPLGLTTGALPFMLQSKLSYSQMGTFALAAYPYSMKLAWSPIVDALYIKRIGRRKSWIIPIQLITAWLMIAYSDRVQAQYEAADVGALTSLFFMFVLLMATQDIAVDGWALTLLPAEHMSYASTCQTLGQTTGIFTSFTVFLALQDANFCNKYLRGGSGFMSKLFGTASSPEGVVSLSGYLRFWGWAFVALTLALAVFKQEKEEELGQGQQQQSGDVDTQQSGSKSHSKGMTKGAGAAFKQALKEVGAAYQELWQVAKLRSVWALAALLLTYRLGVLAAEGAASLKLIDKGVAKEALAFLVLFQFPVELLSALVAGRWAARASPYPPFITGYILRIVTAAATVLLTFTFPPGATSLSSNGRHFGALAAISLSTSFVSYLSFTALGALFTSVSDPAMGGTYLTLLNTIANMGYILPKAPLFFLMDSLTVPACTGGDAASLIGNASFGALQPQLSSLDFGSAHGVATARSLMDLSCPKKMKDVGSSVACVAAGGSCGLASDGYYIVSCVSLAIGLVLGAVYLRTLPTLIRLPLHKWRASGVVAFASDESESGPSTPSAAAAKRRQ